MIGGGPLAAAAFTVGGAAKAVMDPSSPSHSQAVSAAGSIGESFVSIGRSLEPVLTSLMAVAEKVGTTFLTLASRVMPMVESVVTALTPAVTTLVDAIGPLIDVLGTTLADIFKTIAPTVKSVMEALAPVLKDVAAFAGDLASTLGDALKPALEGLKEVVSVVADSVKGSIGLIKEASDKLSGARKWAEDHGFTLSPLTMIKDIKAAFSTPKRARGPTDEPIPETQFPDSWAGVIAKGTGAAIAKSVVGAGGGGGGVHIHKVEVTVSGAQDPNKVARVIGSHLSDFARYRKSSPYVMNFSAWR